MLSGIKFIPRNQIDKDEDDLIEKRKKSSHSKMEKHKRKKKSSRDDGSSDDDLERISKRGSGRKKKWYSSEDYSSQSLSEEDSYDNRRDRRKKRRNCDSSGDENSGSIKKKSKRKEKRYSSKEYSSSAFEDEDQTRIKKDGRRRHMEEDEDESIKSKEVIRKEMGLDWMLRPVESTKRPTDIVETPLDRPLSEEVKKVNPRELNPYLKDNGSGYPDDSDDKGASSDQLPSSAVVGDGGASWRLKALKRAQEQAAREGKKLDKVVEERWGSLGQLAVSAVSHKAAAPRAHLHAIRNRQRGLASADEPQTRTDGQSDRNVEKNVDRSYLKDVSVRDPKMRAPKVHESLSWGKQKPQNRSIEDTGSIAAALSSINKFDNDGSFMSKYLGQQVNDNDSTFSSQVDKECNAKLKVVSPEMDESNKDSPVIKEGLSANQLAAKALQLRLKGKHEEAEKLMQEAENMKLKQIAGENSSKPQKSGSTGRYVLDISARKKEEDADRHLAQKIMQNKQYSLSGRADDEYDFEDGPHKKSRKKGRDSDKVSEKNIIGKRILTQQERCIFCFENPNRPKHLVVSIANFTYLMLPQWQPVVPGHCCILPMQHEAATRSVDNNVWEEIRNFKKCLIMMFAKQDKDLVFLETVMDLAKQRRHCLIECIPLPREIARQAPLYFKKAIDEAEDEWSQHNAKKLIDTSVKGLRGSIPKDFPYFHVEFGLNKGFVHVIDDETQFKSNLGLNVIRGMLQVAEEDMYRRRRREESVETQRQAVIDFAREWEPFDWTKQLD